MPERPNAPYFITEAPEFAYKGGLFHVTQRFGQGEVIERVMRPSVFMVALRRAASCAREHNFIGAEIVELAKRRERDAAEH